MLSAVLVLGGLGALLGFGLAAAAKKLAVDEDPRLEKIVELLPGANCGACGAAGCFGFAQNILQDTENWLGRCPVGGENLVKKAAELLGVEAKDVSKKVVQIRCRGGRDKIVERFRYEGIADCEASFILAGGDKACAYGCLMLDTCQKVCPFGAIIMGPDGLPVVNPKKCTGCGICVKKCPRNLLVLVPFEEKQHIFCASLDQGPVTRKLCTVGCIACGLCVKKCCVEAIKIEDNLAVIDYQKCTNCKDCVLVCPYKCISDLLNKKKEKIPQPLSV